MIAMVAMTGAAIDTAARTAAAISRKREAITG
jgi:hypothetical protein